MHNWCIYPECLYFDGWAPTQPSYHLAFIRAQVMIDRGRIDEPSSCHLCGNTMSMELVHNRCLFTDKQMIRLQVLLPVRRVAQTHERVTIFF